MYSVPSPPASNWMPASPTTLDNRPPASPTSTTSRPGGRLRGLSYLRNYTHNHILSRDHSSSSGSQQRPSGPVRATSYPAPTTARGSTPTSPNPPPTQTSANNLTSARSSDPNNLSSTGALSAVGQNAASRETSDLPTPTTTNPSNSLDPTNFTSPSSMARTRSATVGDATGLLAADSQSRNEADTTAAGDSNRSMSHQLPSIRFSGHQDPRAQRPSLVFTQMSRILPTGKEVIKVGRYSERDSQPQQAANVPSSAPVGFKSKVVSRRHCEFWYSGGRWFIKDVKSSSGTFLNHIRLSPPGTESRPYPVNDGDIVQLGIDFKGGEEMIFRCVKIRVELNKGWQQGPTSFNVQSHKRLRELNNLGAGKPAAGGSSQDCSICLGPIAPCQSLFVAPCSHTWHYKCIRVIINGPNWPHFICPNCRSIADLEAELDEPLVEEEWEKVPVEPEGATQVAESSNIIPPAVNQQQHEDQTYNDTLTTPLTITRTEDSMISQLSTHPDRDTPQTTDASDDSDGRHSVHETTDSSGDTNLLDSPDSPAINTNSTVAPLDIRPRRPVGGTSSHLNRLADRGTRTPSPNGMPSSLTDHLVGHEGPMTPRNDVGPFIFDGSAGRASNLGIPNTVNGNSTSTNTTATHPNHEAP